MFWLTYTETTLTAVTLTIPAHATRITKIGGVQGVRQVTNILNAVPLVTITNCQNYDGTTFSHRISSEAGFQSGIGAVRFRDRQVGMTMRGADRLTIMPGLATTISFGTFPTGQTASLQVWWRWE